MKANEIQVGATYKVLGKKWQVRIEAVCPTGGWTATNLETGGTIKVNSPAYLTKKVADAPAAKPKKPKKAKKAKAAAPAGEKKLSLPSAALAVLQEKGPMHVKPLVEEVVSRGLWTPGAGKTPHATLYAAIITEIAKKGDAARFRKTAKGEFSAA